MSEVHFGFPFFFFLQCPCFRASDKNFMMFTSDFLGVYGTLCCSLDHAYNWIPGISGRYERGKKGVKCNWWCKMVSKFFCCYTKLQSNHQSRYGCWYYYRSTIVYSCSQTYLALTFFPIVPLSRHCAPWTPDLMKGCFWIVVCKKTCHCLNHCEAALFTKRETRWETQTALHYPQTALISDQQAIV